MVMSMNTKTNEECKECEDMRNAKKVNIGEDESGRVHVITGDGKGKTTSGMGMALRALGSGFSVYVMQFMKDGSGGELRVLRALSERLAEIPLRDESRD